jgi:hypothetical protein
MTRYLMFIGLLSSCLTIDMDTNVNTNVNTNVYVDADAKGDVNVVIPIDAGWEILTTNLPDILTKLYDREIPPQVNVLLDGGNIQ